LALVLVLLVGGITVRASVARSFSDADAVRGARMMVADLLKEQLDEETGVRGYTAAKRDVLLQPYDNARAQMPDSFARVGAVLQRLNVPQTQSALDDARRTNARWLAEMARPSIAGTAGSPALQMHGKQLVDRFRADMRLIQDELARQEALADAQAQRAILGIEFFSVLAIAAVVVAAAIFTVQQYQLTERLETGRLEAEEQRHRSAEMQAAYAVEKRIADTLQAAFVQNPLPRPERLWFSGAYVPATEEPNIGGDWYDAFEISGDRVLLAIGDVTGHGLEAAVAMNRTRQLFLSCALSDPEPGQVLARVNVHLLRSRSPLVTAVAGLVDARSHEFSYAVAGHPPPVLAEPGRRPRLLESGSLPLGVMEGATYRTRTIQSVPGAMLVLYTDGAIEQTRDVLEGERLLLDAVERASGEPYEDTAAMICDRILGDRRIADDVAVLVIRFGEESNPSLSGRAL
jgi:serine phosphatase RsbU (regulator of sigma subunit)